MDTLKKILFVLPSMDVGGTEKSLLGLLDTLNGTYDATVLLFEKKGGFLQAIPEWVRVEEVPDYQMIKRYLFESPAVLAVQALKQSRIAEAIALTFNHIRFRITKNRAAHYRYVLSKMAPVSDAYDVAVAYFGPYDILSSYVLEKTTAREKIQWIHFDVKKHPVSRNFMRRQYPRFDKVYAVSKEATANLIEVVPEIAEKAFTRHNVVSAAGCLADAARGSGYTDDFDGIRILTVGRLSEEKGQDMVPDIVLRLKADGYHFRWYLLGDGTLREALNERIKVCGIEDELVLLGAQTNPYPYYKNADLYVQTSRHEGYCLTIAEAKILNKPIVTTNLLVMREQIESGVNGLIADGISVESLYRAIKKLLDDPSLRFAFERNLREEMSKPNAEFEKLNVLYDFAEE